MSRYWIMLALAGAAAVSCTAPSAVTHTGPARAGWGQAIEVPGLGALNVGEHAQVNSVSCASAGNCAAGGFYTDGSGYSQAFVASQVNGSWGTAIEVPGTAVLHPRATAVAGVSSVSCPSAGNCTAGGSYRPGGYLPQAFVASQVNGRWGTAIEVPGTVALNTGGYAGVASVSCASAGNCTIGGSYTEAGDDHHQAFVASQVNGRWGTAIEVPGTAALNIIGPDPGGGGVGSVSCASAGNCAAGGNYTDGSGHVQAFVASQVNGRWGTAIEVPGTAALNTGGWAPVTSVSCGSAGNCTVGGYYSYGPGLDHRQAFVASQVNGRWSTAIEVPGMAALSDAGYAQVSSVSCASAGNCAAGGSYVDGSGHSQAFVASQRNGRWGTAIEVPGTAALNVGGPIGQSAAVISVSCASAGNCAAGGYYEDRAERFQAFVASQRDGRWGTAIEVPGTATLHARESAEVYSVSCAPAGTCAAGGYYTEGGRRSQGFVVSRS